MKAKIQYLFIALMIFTAISVAAQNTTNGWVLQTNAPSTNWFSVASSADGTRLAATVVGGQIYTSGDSGVTWTAQNGAPSTNWGDIVSSADGSKLVAVNYGSAYSSTNGGVTWTGTNIGSPLWIEAGSADGTKIVAAGYETPIYTSTNSGVTWTAQDVLLTNNWRCLASSTNGEKLVAGGYYTPLYTSTNAGVTWIAQNNSSSVYWNALASSADGTKLVAAGHLTPIYTSPDSGVTWNVAFNSFLYWDSLSSSADGTQLAATVNGGYIYISTNSGVTWVAQTNAPSTSWNSIACSADGTKFVAAVFGNQGQIYTYSTTPTASIPFTYITNNGAITITGYTGTGGAVTIPATINGYPVTTIGVDAFNGVSSLTNLIIPTSVTTIGDLAFADCGLTSVIIPGSVTNVGIFAFGGCSSLTNIGVVNSNPAYSSVGGVLFNISQTTLVEYPGGLGQNYTIPGGVTSVGIEAFCSCLTLANVSIPSSVTNLAYAAFAQCTGLAAITIPQSVTSIVSDAFIECGSLKMINFLGNAPTPTNDTTVFQGDNSAIAYYLPGTTGWSSTFDGIPAVLLAPPPPAIGISTYGSQPAVFFPTATGTNYLLQMTTNLTSPVNWVTVTNGLPISGLVITNPPPNAFFRLH